MPKPTISYAQRFEDLYLMRCFGGRGTGFYIDIGSGHPVYDNASFAFYIEGWRGVTVEPNPSLARLSAANASFFAGQSSCRTTSHLRDAPFR